MGASEVMYGTVFILEERQIVRRELQSSVVGVFTSCPKAVAFIKNTKREFDPEEKYWFGGWYEELDPTSLSIKIKMLWFDNDGNLLKDQPL
tara:strand:+ start:158172 stop:158444 length:273 start_codon:yes stop_codon:yes gene_type:complete